MNAVEHHWPELNKASWGDGAWLDEPDKVSWTDEATGYPCIVKRHPQMGHFCGYVAVPEDHPHFGKDYGVPATRRCPSELTFAAPCSKDEDDAHDICHIVQPGQSDNVWWFGFDCAHGWDIIPATQSMSYLRSMFPGASYKDVEWVKNACEQLALDLKQAET